MQTAREAMGGDDASADVAGDQAREFRAALSELAASAQRHAIADFEHEDSGPLDPLVAHAESVLTMASQTFLRVLDHYEAIETRRRSLAPAVPIDALMTSIDEALEEDDGIGRIVSIAFLGRLGVRERGNALRVDRGHDRWESVDVVGSALREVVKASTALDLAIAEYEGLSIERTYFVSEVERSVDTRRAYHRLRQEIVGQGDPTPETVVTRLRRSGAAIAKLTGRPIYGHLRTRDRHQFRRFQERIGAFLVGLVDAGRASTPTDFAAREGIRLYRDLANLTELMMQVNNRVELRGHDATVASALSTALREGLDVSVAQRQLAPMMGRSAELDRMREDPSTSADALAALLERIVGEVDADGGVRRSFVMPTRYGGGS